MPILNKEELEKYSCFRVSELDLKDIFRKASIEKLLLAEKEIEREEGKSLPYYLALQYHLQYNGMTQIANDVNIRLEKLDKQYSISNPTIKKIFDYLDIPIRTQKEATRTRKKYKSVI